MPPQIPPPRDLVLFAHALRLCRLTKGIGSQAPLPERSAALASKAFLPAGVSPAAAQRATVRASSRAARWFGSLDSCLTRAVVAAALLSDHEGVVLHVGFANAADGGGAIKGHAWVTVDGEIVGGPEAGMASAGPASALSISVRRRRPPAPWQPIGGTIESP